MSSLIHRNHSTPASTMASKDRFNEESSSGPPMDPSVLYSKSRLRSVNATSTRARAAHHEASMSLNSILTRADDDLPNTQWSSTSRQSLDKEVFPDFQYASQIRSRSPRHASFQHSQARPSALPYNSDPVFSTFDDSTTSDLDVTADGADAADEEDGEDDSEGPEEYVVALHDFVSTNATCLSFSSGQIIRVFNRDESGWWDGELEGERGWFPSNYVDDSAFASTDVAYDDANDTAYADHAATFSDNFSFALSSQKTPASSSSQHTATYGNATRLVHPYIGRLPSRSPTPTGNGGRKHRSSSLPHPPTHFRSSPFQSILDPIQHAISLLHNAVYANRIPHFQPSTACIISSVRSVLSTTDCLTRESSILKAHPILAKERKQILAELSKLVTQARKASSTAVPIADKSQRHETTEMLHLADQVLVNVQRFLDVAVECGVSIPDQSLSVYDEEDDEIADPKAFANGLRVPGFHANRADADKTPTPESPRSSMYKTAIEEASFRSSFMEQRPGAEMSRFHSVQRQTSRSPNLQHSYQDDERGRYSSAPTESNDGSTSTDEGTTGSPRSGSVESNAAAAAAAAADATPRECVPSEVMDRIQHANDHLLSTIAAFIGHIHGHSRDSHASSYAYLIDMTRDTVDGARNLLAVAEAVYACQALEDSLPKQMALLWETRENVYEATTALVTAARVVTASAQTNNANKAMTRDPGSPGAEEIEKSNLLQAATAVLRTGGECVGAVKLCLSRADASTRILLAMPSSTQSFKSPETSFNDEEAEGGERRIEQPGRVRRGKHTLSFLGRKSTSLSCLRDRYDTDKESNRHATSRSPQVTDIAEDLYDPLSASSSSTAGNGLSATLEGGEASDTSEPMSREHSRASASTLHSARSGQTPNTSARPSMDRSDLPMSIDGELGLPSALISRFGGKETPVGHSSNGFTLTERSASLPRSDVQSASLTVPLPSPTLPSPPKKMGRSLSSDARILAPDHGMTDVCFNSEGQLTGATLKALVEKMTPHNTTIDATLSNAFFLCFRLFTSPQELFETIKARYNMRAPAEVEMNADDFIRWTELKVAPVRLRIFNLLKLWLENHWNASADHVILEGLIAFAQTSMTHSLHRPGQRLVELAQKRYTEGPHAKTVTAVMASNTASALGRGTGTLKRMVSTDRVKTPGLTDISNLYTSASLAKSTIPPPAPIVSKGMMNQLRNGPAAKVNVTEIDALELARQLTIMESRIYCSILPEELLGQEFSKKLGVSTAINIKQMSALSTHITGWVSECILGEEDARKRTQLVKFFVKLGDRCLTLNNYNALFAIQGALNSSTIARLKKTWDGVSTKYRQLMEQQRHAVEHTRNFAGYRQRLRSTLPPALPFVGLFLTDLTFCHEGNAPTRPSPQEPSKRLINFDKYVKMSRIIGDLQRFQTPYNLMEVPELQAYLRQMLEGASQGNSAITADELYRRSLRLEPRSNGLGPLTEGGGNVNAQNGGTITARSLAGGVGLDIFNWK